MRGRRQTNASLARKFSVGYVNRNEVSSLQPGGGSMGSGHAGRGCRFSDVKTVAFRGARAGGGYISDRTPGVLARESGWKVAPGSSRAGATTASTSRRAPVRRRARALSR